MPPPPFTGGGLDRSGGCQCFLDGDGLGFEGPVPRVGRTVNFDGAGVVFGGTTTVFVGAACVGDRFSEALARASGFGVRLGCGVGVGFGVDFGVSVGVSIAIDEGDDGVPTSVGDGVAAVGCGVVCGVGDAELCDAVADGTSGSALAELSLPPKPDQVIANAVNATTTTAKATSASVERRGNLSS